MCDFKQSTERVGLKSTQTRRKFRWVNNDVSTTGNSRDQTSNQGRLGVVLQVQTRIDIKIVPHAAQTPLAQYGDHAGAELRFWHMDTIKRTCKNDTIDPTPNASLHRPNEKNIQKENTDQQERER